MIYRMLKEKEKFKIGDQYLRDAENWETLSMDDVSLLNDFNVRFHISQYISPLRRKK